MENIKKYTEQNRRAWNQIAEVRAARWAEKHPVEQLRRGGTLSQEVKEAAGSVSGKELLHLQCASGEDSISWAALGARVTAVDISERLIELAGKRAKEVDLSIEFVAADIYNLPESLQKGSFDIVFMGGGVLTWLPDLGRWASVISEALHAGGRFLIEEEHPLAQTMVVHDGRIEMSEDYFQRGKVIEEPPGWAHFDDRGLGTETKYEFLWNLGDVVSAVAGAGLRVDRLVEFPTTPDQRWRYGDRLADAAAMPGVFLLEATKTPIVEDLGT